MTHDEKIKLLNVRPDQPGEYVLYWMQAAHRVHCNHALTYAIRLANERRLPVLIGFGLTDDYPEANERHYAFMLEGLKEVSVAATKKRLGFALLKGAPDLVAIELGRKAAALVTDRGYLRIQREWRERVAAESHCPVVQVETEAIVPVEAVSDKEEYAARTIRPRIHRLLGQYLIPLVETKVSVPYTASAPGSLSVDNLDELLESLVIDRSVGRTSFHLGGISQARAKLRAFVRDRLAGYEADRNDPNKDGVSGLSPYLHYGQIAPLEIALEIHSTAKASGAAGADTFLEELIVRRELSINFCTFQPAYDRYDCLPDWCRDTLDAHREDPREVVYSLKEFETAKTHDAYWNAAQIEMVATGKMHNYMRMYWGKKIIEWSASPEEAFKTALYLNNKYELDGRDVNSYAGVAWCFGKHDRPWKERPVFGMVRYMNDRGLRRKFDADGYVDRVSTLTGCDFPSQRELF